MFTHARARIQPLADGYSMLHISPRLAVCYRALKKPGKNGRMDKIQCAYFGFDDERIAKAWLEKIRHKHNNSVIKAVVREGDRLTHCSYEVKVWEFDALLPLILACAKQVNHQTAA